MLNRIPGDGNISLGIPRSERVYVLTDNKIHLRGPPINIHFSPEYDEYTIRCYNGVSYETLRWGVCGIYNISTMTWTTDTISDINEVGTEIETSSGVGKGHSVMVYYYSAVATTGGPYVGAIKGDNPGIEWMKIPAKAYVDSHPTTFGEYSSSGDGTSEWHYALDAMYNTAVSCTADTWVTVLDTTGTGTKRWTNYPVYIAELALRGPYNSTNEDTINYRFRITLDGKTIISSFESSNLYDYAVTGSMSPYHYDADTVYYVTPGNLGNTVVGQTTNINSIFDSYRGFNNTASQSRRVWKFDLNCEMLTSLKVEVFSPDSARNFDAYLRGWYVPT